MRPFHRFFRNLRYHHASALLGVFILGNVGLEPLGTREPQLEAQDPRGLEPGVGHVVAVADPRDALPFPAAEVLLDREEVGEDLAGVGEVGEPVDHRNRGEPGQLLDLGVVVGADHDAVHVAREHAGGIGDRLAAADLDVLAGEEEGLAAELVGADLKGDAGPGGRLGEDHGQGFPGEGGLPVLLGLHPFGEVEELLDLRTAEVGDLEEVALRQVLTP